MLHDSGTGGQPSLGNFPFFVYPSCPGDDINRCDFPQKTRVKHGAFKPENVKAQPGYFSILLDMGVQAEMTTTQHTALFRFTLPNGTGANGTYPFVMQDLSDLSNTRQDNGTVSVDAQTGRISGGARFNPSFGIGTYQAYFCTDFSGPAIQDNGIFVNSRATTEAKDLTISRSINGYPLPGGAFVRFRDASSPILARTGVSFISTEQACANAEAEIPDFNFDTVTKAAKDAWRAKLSPITVSTGGGVQQDLITNFYSGIYRTMVNPQNYTGENPMYKSSEPYFDSFYWLVGVRYHAKRLTNNVLQPMGQLPISDSILGHPRSCRCSPDDSLVDRYIQTRGVAARLQDVPVQGIHSGRFAFAIYEVPILTV